MKLPDQIRSLFAVLLKNGLISVDEIAMFRVHREEDKKQMLDIVKRLYENRVVRRGELETTLVGEGDVFMLIDYIADDPISAKVNDKDNWNGIKIEPTPYYPQDPIKVVPLTYPATPVDPAPWQLPRIYYSHQPDNNCYCVTTSTMC